jgi:hypothetical protein
MALLKSWEMAKSKQPLTAKIYIGIDPAFRKNGFCICCIDTSDNSVSFKTVKNGLLDFFSWVINDAPTKEDCIICVENSNLQDTFFYTHTAINGGALLTFQQSKSIKSRPLNNNEAAKANRSVGKNMAASQITVDFLAVHNYLVVDLSPKDKGAKYNDSTFQAVAKQNKHSVPKKASQDEMDAYKLAGLAKQLSYLAK